MFRLLYVNYFLLKTLGGEGPIQAAQTSHPLAFTTTLAGQFGGALMQLEHRYYGESFPTA